MTDKKFVFKSISDSRKVLTDGSEFKEGYDGIFSNRVVESNPRMEPEVEYKKNLYKKEEGDGAAPQTKIKYTEEDLAKSRTSGYEDGYSKGYNAAKSEELELNKNIEKILLSSEAALNKALLDKKNLDNGTHPQIAIIVAKIAKKIAGDAMQQEPIKRIEQIIKEVTKKLFDEPAIKIYVNDEILGSLIQKIDSIKKSSGYTGQINFAGSNQIDKSDCKLEWSGGGAKYEKKQIIDEIDKICDNFFECDNN